jgi:hypothetical protein
MLNEDHDQVPSEPAVVHTTEGAEARWDLADLASQTFGIPGRLALQLADRYLQLSTAHEGGAFLAWIGGGGASARTLPFGG